MTMHLHWAWKQGPTITRDITKGFTVCGRQVPRGEFTSFQEETDCTKCLAKLRAPDVSQDVPTPPVVKDTARIKMMRQAAKKGDLK